MSPRTDPPRDAFIDFRALAKTGLSNEHLVAPRGYCPGPADAEAPVFAASAARLAAAVEAALARAPRTRLLRADRAVRQFVYQQRSPVFRFPDIVRIQLVPLGESRSTLAIHSRSVYGRNDLGANRRRVRRWLSAIEAEIGHAPRAAVAEPPGKA
jgi:uncharacterized protein (DUF1499 family)